MSTFVEIDPSEYDGAAFARFDAKADDFKIANARALMWLSQLAYEAHREETIREVAQKWSLKSVTPFIKRKTGLKNSYETCGIIAQRDDAVMLAFAGTDPGIWQNLVTDFTPLPQVGSDIHEGFRQAALAAKDEIDRAVSLAQQSQNPLFIAGHSLGAALAALAAVQAATRGTPPRAVYGFGMPRVGGERFRAAYGALGQRTYRLVNGSDVVARVPPVGFRHVGRVLQCDAGTKFDENVPLLDTDEPKLSAQFGNISDRGLGNLFRGSILSPVGPGTFGPLFKFIPPELRDHLQDSYWKALTP